MSPSSFEDMVKGEHGFVFGLRAVLDGARFVVRTRAVWPYALVPAILLVVLMAAAAAASFNWIAPAILPRDATPGGPWARYFGDALFYALAGLATFLGCLLALALTPPLSGPALEHIVRVRERELAVTPHPSLGLLSEIACGLRAQAVGAAFALPLLGLILIVDFLVPPLAVVTAPLKWAVISFGVAWNLFDYPLTLRGVRMRARVRLVARNKATLLGFGLGYALVSVVACCGVLMLPVGVAAATRVLWAIIARDPDAPSELRNARFPLAAPPV